MSFNKGIFGRVFLPCLLILVILTSVVVSMVYAKYAENKNDNLSFNVVAEGNLDIAVTKESGDVYRVTNTDESNMPAYVRVAVVVGLQNESGQLWIDSPIENSEYTLSVENCTLLSDGYYYYNGIRNKNDSFKVEVSPKNLPAGYTLYVQVLAEGIQCLPKTTPNSTWNASFNDTEGTWSKLNNN